MEFWEALKSDIRAFAQQQGRQPRVMIAKLGPRRFAAEGSPADCVLAAIYDVLDGARPDLVLSGVNRGNNAAENVLYSGTIGGAMEAALQGIPAIALSQFFGPENADLADPFDSARVHGAAVVRSLLDRGLWTTDDYRVFYNVNFPPLTGTATRGLQVAAQGFRRDTAFSVEPHHSPSGRKFLWIKGGQQHSPTLPGTDAAVNLDGYISVTPMRADLTAHDLLADLQARLEVLIWERLGDDVELRLTRGETNDIRIDGKFIEKPLEVKRVVSEALGEIMEDFDSSAYTL